jgi:hypothetical protein
MPIGKTMTPKMAWMLVSGCHDAVDTEPTLLGPVLTTFIGTYIHSMFLADEPEKLKRHHHMYHDYAQGVTCQGLCEEISFHQSPNP